MAIREYFNKYNRYNPNKWVWQPYIYAHNCSLEEQREWNDLYLRFRGRRNGKDKIISDFSSIEKDADQFGRREVTFTDIFGLKWSGRKGAEEEIDEPDYEGHLYYWDDDDIDCEEEALVSDYDAYDNQPNKDVYFRFKVGYPRWRDEWIDIKNIKSIQYFYVVENHLFKDTRLTLTYDNDEKVDLFDSHNYNDVVKAFKKFGRTDLLEELYKSVNEHFDALKNSEREENREYWPGCTAEEYFKKHEDD